MKKHLITGLTCVILLYYLVLQGMHWKARVYIDKRLDDVKMLSHAFNQIQAFKNNLAYIKNSTNVTIEMLTNYLWSAGKTLNFPVSDNEKYRYRMVYPLRLIKKGDDIVKVIIEDNDNDDDICFSIEDGHGLILKRSEYNKLLMGAVREE